MSDRLKELQHQRALAQEQLAWLEREIARETVTAPVGVSLPVASPAASVVPAGAPPAVPIAPEIPSGFTQEPAGGMAKDAKRGCIVAFVIGMTVFFTLLAGAYLLYLKYRSAPL